MTENYITIVIWLKRCSTCKTLKSATPLHFYRDKKKGLSSQCKVCKNAYTKTPKGRLVKREKYKKWAHTDSGRQATQRVRRKRYKTTPEKQKAKAAVYLAVTNGDLPHVTCCACSLCGNNAHEYHHWSYDHAHWLDVIPLCRSCHRKIHQMDARERINTEQQMLKGMKP